MKLTPAETWHDNGYNPEAIAFTPTERRRNRINFIRQIQADALRAAERKFAVAFNEFVSSRKELKRIHGQVIGAESYRLEFTGFQLDAVADVLANIELEANQLHPLRESNITTVTESDIRGYKV